MESFYNLNLIRPPEKYMSFYYQFMSMAQIILDLDRKSVSIGPSQIRKSELAVQVTIPNSWVESVQSIIRCAQNCWGDCSQGLSSWCYVKAILEQYSRNVPQWSKSSEVFFVSIYLINCCLVVCIWKSHSEAFRPTWEVGIIEALNIQYQSHSILNAKYRWKWLVLIVAK